MRGFLIDECIGLRCLVLSKDNQFLFFGKVAHYDSVNQTVRVVEYNHHPFGKCVIPGAQIKLHIKRNNEEKGFVLIEGVATQFMEHWLLITPNSVVEKQEERGYFRQNVMRESVISFVNRKAAGQPCMIIDVSATGIAIQSKAVYELDDRLWIYNQRFRHNGPFHNAECVVVRRNALGDQNYFYGCKFVDLSMEEEDKLFDDIFALQATDLYAKKNK